MTDHDRIPVSRPSGHHMSCSCGWTSEGCETPALAFRAYLAHIDSHAADVAERIIAATPPFRPNRHDSAHGAIPGRSPEHTEGTRDAQPTA